MPRRLSDYDLNRLREVWQANRYASASALHTFARRAGIDATLSQIKDFLDRVGSAENREVYTIPKQDGRAFARHEGDEVKVDLMDRERRPAPDGSRYILVAQDAFSRKLYAENLLNKSTAATAEAFQRILARMPRKPETVLTDLGREWQGTFERLLDQRDIVHKDKEPEDHGAFATLDRAIRTVKKGLALRVDDGTPWHEATAPTVRQYNATPNATTGTAPGDVHGSPEAQFFISKQMSDAWKHNRAVHERRVDAIERVGGFRAQLPRPSDHRWREDTKRFGRPRALLDADRATQFMFGRAHDENGHSTLVKRALPTSQR